MAIDGAAPEAVTVDLGDGRLGELPQSQRRPEEEVVVVLLPGPFRSRAGGGVDVGHLFVADDGVAGAEPLAVRLHDEDLHLLVAIGPGQAVLEVPYLLGGLDVRLLRHVQHDASDRAVLLVDDRLEFLALHATPLDKAQDGFAPFSAATLTASQQGTLPIASQGSMKPMSSPTG